jgi:hypothetical protein
MSLGSGRVCRKFCTGEEYIDCFSVADFGFVAAYFIAALRYSLLRLQQHRLLPAQFRWIMYCIRPYRLRPRRCSCVCVHTDYICVDSAAPWSASTATCHGRGLYLNMAHACPSSFDSSEVTPSTTTSPSIVAVILRQQLAYCYSKVMAPEKSWGRVNNVGADVLVRGE